MSEITPITSTAQAVIEDNPAGGAESTRVDDAVEAPAVTADGQISAGDTVDPEGGTASSRLANMLRGHQLKGQGSAEYVEDASGVNERVQK